MTYSVWIRACLINSICPSCKAPIVGTSPIFIPFLETFDNSSSRDVNSFMLYIRGVKKSIMVFDKELINNDVKIS